MSTGTSDRPAEHVEQLIDRMSKDSFPASDAPQLAGFEQDGAPAHNAVPRHPPTHAPPPDVGPLPGSDAAPFDRDGRYALHDWGEVRLRTVGGEVEIELPANPLVLDVTALETLIALLERHRPALQSQ